jgi:hypothetical protein
MKRHAAPVGGIWLYGCLWTAAFSGFVAYGGLGRAPGPSFAQPVFVVAMVLVALTIVMGLWRAPRRRRPPR